MKRQAFPLAAFSIVLGLLCPAHRVHAEATADAQLSFTNLSIAAAGGTIQWMADWQGIAFSQAGVNNQYNSGANPIATALGDYSLAQGQSSAPPAPGMNVYGLGQADASVPGATEASDEGTGRGTVLDQFMILGGSGSVDATFSLDISGYLSVLTDTYGESADAETVLSLELDGTPVLFDFRVLSIGANDQGNQGISTTLNNTVTLQYGTVYSLYLEGDSEVMVNNVPEPGPGILLAGLGLFWALSRNLRLRRKGGAAAWILAGLAVGAPGVTQAMYIGGDPPDVCLKCGFPATRQSAGAIATSLTEGNSREEYPVVTLHSGTGPTLEFSLTYNSYNADGSRAQVDCGLGLGWTHSYNSFLFQQRGSLFRMGPDGRVTLYHLAFGGGYQTDSGYFETLTPQVDGSYIVTNKQQSWWRFASIPNTPFQVGGPVYRLTTMGDRDGNITTLTYSNGLLTQITDTYGRSLTLTYTNMSKLWMITDPLGRTTRIDYDSRWRTPLKITDPQGNVVRYSYNGLYQITRKIDRDGRMYLYLFRNQRPWAVVDGNGQPYFMLSNSNQWAVDRLTVASSLRRAYIPSLVTNIDGRGNVWRYQYDTNGYITQTVAPDGSTTSYGYDTTTRLLTSETNANGYITRYQYDAEGNRTNVTDALGNVTSYTYDPVFNEITQMVDPNGRTTVYQYDLQGNLTNEIDPLVQTQSWTYDIHGNVLSETDKNGHTTTYSYDAFGERTNAVDALGNTTTSTYDSDGMLQSTTDPLGHTTRFTYDALDRLIGTTNAVGGVTTYTYDALGRQTQMTDPNTNTTTSVYDDRGRLVETIDALGGVTRYTYDANNNMVSRTNQLDQTTTYGYDGLDRVVETTDALGGVTTTAYDAVGNVTNLVDANGHTNTYTYDALNRRTSMTDALGNVTRYDYAAPGGPPCCSPTLGSSLVTREEDPDGHVTFFKYDDLNRLTQVVRKRGDTNDVIDGDDAVTTTTYDANGNQLGVVDPVGNTTTYTYDPLNRQTSFVDGEGNTTVTTYDADGNLLTTTRPGGNTVTNVYDALDRAVEMKDQVGPIMTFTYDEDGNRISSTDGEGNTTYTSYDALNRVISTIDPLGHTNLTVYDALGNVTSQVDRNGRATSYTYDELNRRTSVADALGNVTTNRYDAVGNIIEITDPNGHATTYSYDAANRSVGVTYPDSPPNTVTFAYDPDGNRISRTDQDGRVTTYSYDDLNLLTNRAYTSGANDGFTYDLAGRLLTADRDGWIDTFGYDAANRVTNTTENGRPLTYSYDLSNRVQTNAYPSGRVTRYSYDGRNRLATVQDATPAPPIATYTYDTANRVVTRDYRNGTTTTYTYDADSRLTSIEHSNTVGRIAGFGYAYDPEGNRLLEEKRHHTTDSQAYTYDAVDRLTNHDVGMLVGPTIPSPSTTKAWTLDAVGNWSDVASNGVPQLRTHGPANELLTIDTTNILSYDSNGNLAQDIYYAYSYDEENRLTQVQRLSDAVVVGQYYYDALGRRVARITAPLGSPSTNFYYYDKTRVVEEEDSSGATVATYIYGNYEDEVLTMDRGGQTYYYHPNASCSVEAITDNTGTPVERYTYDAYGQVTELDSAYNPLPLNAWGTPHSAVGNPWLFTGRYLDEETGLYDYRAREYHPAWGRFLQRDPLGYVDGLNLYAYVDDDPVGRIDPSGLLLVAVDGTASLKWSKHEDFTIGKFNQSHVANFYDDYQGAALYVHGPNSLTKGDAGKESFNIHIYAQKWLCSRWCKTKEDIDMVGHSRGGNIVLRIAQALQEIGCPCCDGWKKPVPVRFLGLYDAVDMTEGYLGGKHTIPKNVKKAVVMLRDPKTGSRNGNWVWSAWGWAYDDSEPNPGTEAILVWGTHAAIGGAVGDWEDTKVTREQNIFAAREVDKLMRKRARAVGVPISVRPDSYYEYK